MAAADWSDDLTEWLEYFVQGIAVEMVRLEERIRGLERIVGQAAVPRTAAMDLNPRQIRALEFLAREPKLTTADEHTFVVLSQSANADKCTAVARYLDKGRRPCHVPNRSLISRLLRQIYYINVILT